MKRRRFLSSIEFQMGVATLCLALSASKFICKSFSEVAKINVNKQISNHNMNLEFKDGYELERKGGWHSWAPID
jgi:hypothetical protein